MTQRLYVLRVAGKADRTFSDFKAVVRYATAEAARLRRAGRIEDARDVTIDERDA